MIAFAAALLLRYALQRRLGTSVPYLHFFPAIVVASWYGGFGPGAIVTGLAAVASVYASVPPDSFAIDGARGAIPLAVFVLTGLAIAGLNHRRLAERARLGERLRTSEARWRAIVDSAVDAIIVIDRHGRIESFNPAAERLFGHTEVDVLGRNVDTLMPSPYREEHDGYLSRYLATGRATIIGKGREVTALRKDGTTFPVHLSVGEMTIAGEQKFTGILHDLSDRVRMEARIREQTSLARLGEMAAVIAHEVKNPLAGIRGAIQVLGGRLAKEGTAPPILSEIVGRIDSLDAMMKDLLLFARTPEPRRAPTDVVRLISATADLVTQDPSLQNVEVEVEGSAPPLSVDAGMLEIVFQNLLMNGAHAMHGHGRIAVAVTVVDTACRIAFTDAGPGIPADVRDKVFTPFFTTKSRGSGLGLSTAKRLVEAHDGQIFVDCPPAGGTTVVVHLPLRS